MNKWSSFIYLNWQDEEINTKTLPACIIYNSIYLYENKV